MSMKYIHCTCGQPMVFNVSKPVDSKSAEQTVNVIKSIRIGGGACVITRDNRIPKVVITPVTEDELAILERMEAFQNMKRRGFITIHDVDHMEADSSGHPMDQERKDNTSQITDEDHAKGTDERCNHASTRATYGEDNQYGGEQPASSVDSKYGPINL